MKQEESLQLFLSELFNEEELMVLNEINSQGEENVIIQGILDKLSGKEDCDD